jgi:hypothetical protein
MSDQQSDKRGKRSTAQKRDSSRHDFGPIPATSKVSGASGGNQPTGRTMTETMEHYTEEDMRKRASDGGKAPEETSSDDK